MCWSNKCSVLHFSVAFVKLLLSVCKEQWIILANKVGSDLWKQDIGLTSISFILVKVEEWQLCLLSLRSAELPVLSGLAILSCVCSGTGGLFNSTVHSSVQICAYLCPGWWQILYELELRWKLTPLTSFNVLGCNSKELRHTWLCLGVEGPIWILQHWAFINCWFGFENNQDKSGRNPLQDPHRNIPERRKYFLFGPYV